MLEYDNIICADFESLVDLDIAIFRFIKNNYADSKYVDKEFIGINDERLVEQKLLNREMINPLEIIMPGADTLEMYQDLMTKDQDKILEYAVPYDTLFLMMRFLRSVASVMIDISCRNDLQADFIAKAEPRLKNHIKIHPEKKAIDVNDYTIFYVKYVLNLVEYKHLEGKHIYLPAAKYNLNLTMIDLFDDVNIFHFMDVYQDDILKYWVKKEGTE